MNESHIVLKIVELAKVGGAMPPEEAISHVALLVNNLDMHASTYARDLEALLRIGATIWNLNSGPKGAFDPTYIPPRIHP